MSNVKLGSDRVASCESSISRNLFISFLSKSKTATTEILRALHAVKHNYLANLCDKVVQLNNKMYPDSPIFIYDKVWFNFQNTLLDAINKFR